MRCPKCHYLSFEPEPRCKNCGYDLSFEPGDLTITATETSDQPLVEFDLPLRDVPAQPLGSPADDLRVADASNDQPASAAATSVAAIVDLPAAIRPVLPGPAPSSVSAPPPTAELPLFVQTRSRVDLPNARSRVDLPNARSRVGHDDPLVKLPRAPRPPLAVRRPTPAPGRVREKYQREAPVRQVGLLEPDLLDVRPRDDAPPVLPVEAPGGVVNLGEEAPARPAGAFRRIEAAFLDLVFLGAINFVVVWLTLQRCDLTVAEASHLPWLPLVAYLFLVDGGYLLMFTVTNGQTIGKMAAGLKVIGASITDRVTLKQAAVRAVLTFPSVLVLGLGFMPALLGRGPTLHDRFAHTRVVRA